MPSNKAIVVLIGNNGTLISKHSSSTITSEFIDNFTEEKHAKISEIFLQNPNLPVYILLDTIDQTYKKKIFPSIRQSDLNKIIKRDLSSDGDNDSLKNYIILKNNKPNNKKSPSKKIDTKTTKSECLFVISSKSDKINNWLNFLYGMPNRLVGIYMLPVEAFSFFKKLLLASSPTKTSSVVNLKANYIYCLVLQTKAGGARQIVFSNSSIVFTRVINYNFEESNFAEKYSQDIYSTFEYLKRLYIDLTIQEFEVINILEDKHYAEIIRTKNNELSIKNYSAKEAISLLKLRNIPLEDDFSKNNFSDLIINSIFCESKKILRFTTGRIEAQEFLILLKKSFNIVNFILFALLLISTLTTILLNESISNKINEAQDKKLLALNDLGAIKKTSTKGGLQGEFNIEKIVDIGRIEEGLGQLNCNLIETYSSLNFITNFDVKFNSFIYSLESFNPRIANNIGNEKQIILNGKIFNKNGDIENLFTDFDKFVVEMKNNLPNNEIKYNDLPKNIDFNQKYYDLPIEFRITPKKIIRNESSNN